MNVEVLGKTEYNFVARQIGLEGSKTTLLQAYSQYIVPGLTNLIWNIHLEYYRGNETEFG